MYEKYKIYGPYKRKDGRLHVVLFDGKKRKTISYPKYLMEIHLNRYLEEWETIDHIDRNFNNNEISNLRILSKGEHTKKDLKRPSDVETKCVWCNNTFTIKGKDVHKRNRGKSGPFCSKKCIGEYSTKRKKDAPLNSVEKKYHYLEI